MTMRVGVTGHQVMTDRAWDRVRAAMTQVLAGMGPHPIGISSLAVGADQLFARLLLDMGGRLHVVIPCRDYESTFKTQEDLANYTELLGRATKRYRLRARRPSERAFRSAGRRVVRLSDQMVAVLDLSSGTQPKGGTADIVRYARRREKRVHNVWPPDERRPDGDVSATFGSTSS